MLLIHLPLRYVGRSMAIAAAGLLLAAGAAPAQQRELNEGHPVRLADAFPIATGEAALLAAASAVVPRESSPRAVFPLDVQYSPLAHFQLGVGTLLSSRPSAELDPAAGDVGVAGRFSFGRETWVLPYVATQVAVTMPTGIGSHGTDVELKGYATKSHTVGTLPMFFHLNAAVDFRAAGLERDERLARYHLAAGTSFAVPVQASTSIVADVYADQSVRLGEPVAVGLELGARRRLAPNLALDAGIGTEVAGPRDRAAVFVTIGFTWGFEVGGSH